MANQYAGWYPDPSGDTSKLRYWDGAQWTHDFCDSWQATQPVPPFGQTPPTQHYQSTGASAQPQVVVTETVYSYPGGTQSRVNQVYTQAPVDSSKQALRMAAFVFCLVSTVSVGWLIIPLAWMIPMTVHSWGIYKGTQRNTTAFGVCTLLFVSLVSGILLLISGEDN